MCTILHTYTIQLLLIYVRNHCVFMVCGFSFGKYVFIFLHLQCFVWFDLWLTLNTSVSISSVPRQELVSLQGH